MSTRILFVFLAAFSPYLALTTTILGFFVYLGVIFRMAHAAWRDRARRTVTLKGQS